MRGQVFGILPYTPNRAGNPQSGRSTLGIVRSLLPLPRGTTLIPHLAPSIYGAGHLVNTTFCQWQNQAGELIWAPIFHIAASAAPLLGCLYLWVCKNAYISAFPNELWVQASGQHPVVRITYQIW